MMFSRNHLSSSCSAAVCWLCVFWLCAAAPSWADEGVPVYDFEIVNRFPHNMQSFTQGLLIEQGRLYENTGRYGQSALMEVRLEDGEILRSRALSPRYFGEGIAVADGLIYQLTWRENAVFVYDLETFDLVDSHYLPTEGWGLTYDGERLLLSDGTDRLYHIDPDGFRIISSVQVTVDGAPQANINELEFIDGEVWANVWLTDTLVRIDPETGEVQGIVDLGGLRQQTRVGGSEAVLNGIAWDADQKRLFVTGKLWEHLFEITVHRRQ